MSEEEKQAIEGLRKNRGVSFAQADIISNLIEKQQKAIEELKDKNKTLERLLQGNLYELYLYYKELAGKYQANCISKDEIRNILKQVNASLYHFKDSEKNNIIQRLKDKLEQLLEE